MRHLSAGLAALALTLLPAAGCRGPEGATGPEAPAPLPALPLAAPPCVHFHALRAYLPIPPEGWAQVKETGSTGKYGEVSVSEAERVFRHDEGREVAVRIVDTTLVDRMASAIRAAADEGRARAPADPLAPLFLAEAVGFVRYDAHEARAEANLLVGGRYVVAVTSRGFPGTVEVRRLARTLDLAGLSRLR